MSPSPPTMSALSTQPKILIVEDEIDLLRTLEYNFRQAGFDVLTTAHGRDALRLIADPTTALEFRLLWTLASRQGRVQTREMLLNDVWGLHLNVETRTVDTHVKRLREKLGSAGALIQTVRGVGYRLAIDGDAE